MARTKRLPPNVRWNAARGTYELSKRDKRLTGGRVSLSLSTADRDEAIARRGDFMTLLDAGRRGVIEALRARTVHWSDVRRAIRDGDYSELQTSLVPMPTLGEAKAAIIAEVRATRRASTADMYEKYLNALVSHFGADTLLDALSTEDIRSWLRAPKHGRRDRKTPPRPWSQNTQVMARTFGKRMYDLQIRALAEQAERQKTVPPIRRNPFDAVEVTREGGTRVEYLRPAEWQKLSERCEGTPEHAIVALGTLAGLRIGEITHLRTDLDIDWEKRLLRIQPRGGRWPWKPKTPRSVRVVPMANELYRILTHHRERFAGDVYLIIAAGRDQPMATVTVRKWVQRAFEAVNIVYGQKEDGLTPHSLRHTFASWLVQRDVQLMKVAELLGDTVKEVVETYAHLMRRDLVVAVRTIDEVARKSAEPTADPTA